MKDHSGKLKFSVAAELGAHIHMNFRKRHDPVDWVCHREASSLQPNE